MKYAISELVIYNDEKALIRDYSHRHKEYTLYLTHHDDSSNRIRYGVKENELEKLRRKRYE